MTDATSTRPRVSRAGAIAGSLASWYVIFAVVPAALGRRGRRLGWQAGRPGILNRLGLVPLGLGVGGLLWCMRSHYPAGQDVEVSLVPERLVGSGPYSHSRNPMYVSEQSIWLGWTLYYGSPLLATGAAALGTAMRYAVAREERTLESRFGDAWREYAARVRRWL